MAEKLSLKALNEKISSQAEDTEDRLEAIEGSVTNLSESIESQFAQVLESLKAVHTPVSISKEGVSSEDRYFHEDEHGINFKDNTDPNQDVELIRPGLHSVDSAEFKDKAEQTRFDMENIQVQVQPSGATYPDHTFTLGVNGRMILIVRGAKQWIPRCYAEVMARAKTSSYGNQEILDPNTFERKIKNDETRSHRYPFQVIQDKNPMGMHWLERVLNDPA